MSHWGSESINGNSNRSLTPGPDRWITPYELTPGPDGWIRPSAPALGPEGWIRPQGPNHHHHHHHHHHGQKPEHHRPGHHGHHGHHGHGHRGGRHHHKRHSPSRKTNSVSSGAYSWVEARNGSVPWNAVKVGQDKDGGFIYAGRAYHEGDLLPAKVCPTHGGAFVPWGGQEHSKFEYSVLCSSNVGWVGASNGAIPPRAICVGQTRQGESIYLGRTMHDGTLTPGKVQPSHRVLYIPYGGQELSFHEYEVAVIV